MGSMFNIQFDHAVDALTTHAPPSSKSQNLHAILKQLSNNLGSEKRVSNKLVVTCAFGRHAAMGDCVPGLGEFGFKIGNCP